MLTVLRHRWGRLVLLLSLIEGAALLGFLTYLPPLLESGGQSPTAAGLVVALYGIGLLLASRVVKRQVSRVRPELLAEFQLHPTSRPCIQTALALYGGILDEVERADYQVLTQRVSVGPGRRAAVAGPGLLRAWRARH